MKIPRVIILRWHFLFRNILNFNLQWQELPPQAAFAAQNLENLAIFDAQGRFRSCSSCKSISSMQVTFAVSVRRTWRWPAITWPISAAPSADIAPAVLRQCPTMSNCSTPLVRLKITESPHNCLYWPYFPSQARVRPWQELHPAGGDVLCLWLQCPQWKQTRQAPRN